jgi:glycosyltransferase involved in cell wall biosynthesis
MFDASLIISFYNNIDFLKLVFAGLERQTFRNFEIIIADDGSTAEAVSELENLISSTLYKVTHLWQEDNGFRKNKILNRAIASSSSEYLIFIDGDCIPHSEFINEHNKNRQRNICLTGRRVNLSDKISDMLTPEKIKLGYLENHTLKLIWDSLTGTTIDAEKGIYLKNKFLRKAVTIKKRGLLGCNFSIFKDDILKINGFDERYILPSIGEDSDIQYRLELAGVTIKSLNNIAVQYHLFHKLQERQKSNLDLFDKIKSEGKYFTPYGIKKLF